VGAQEAIKVIGDNDPITVTLHHTLHSSPFSLLSPLTFHLCSFFFYPPRRSSRGSTRHWTTRTSSTASPPWEPPTPCRSCSCVAIALDVAIVAIVKIVTNVYLSTVKVIEEYFLVMFVWPFVLSLENPSLVYAKLSPVFEKPFQGFEKPISGF
jgi:hypothetical protein